MSVTSKTLGVVLIGLVGLLVYVGFYLTGAFVPAAAGVIVYIGLALTALLMIILVALTATAD